MKAAAYTFLFILVFFTMQPFFSIVSDKSESSQCASKATCCKKAKKVPVEKDGCEKKGCNPFMGCVYGNFYTFVSSFLHLSPLIVPKQKRETFNDNRVVSNSSDCWHPPKNT
jgi:hypothetical protein